MEERSVHFSDATKSTQQQNVQVLRHKMYAYGVNTYFCLVKQQHFSFYVLTLLVTQRPWVRILAHLKIYFYNAEIYLKLWLEESGQSAYNCL